LGVSNILCEEKTLKRVLAALHHGDLARVEQGLQEALGLSS
jgi:hypothetical protein